MIYKRLCLRSSTRHSKQVLPECRLFLFWAISGSLHNAQGVVNTLTERDRESERAIDGECAFRPVLCVRVRERLCISQGGKDPQDAFNCRSLLAKEPWIIGLFCRKWPVKVRHPMGLCHLNMTRYIYICIWYIYIYIYILTPYTTWYTPWHDKCIYILTTYISCKKAKQVLPYCRVSELIILHANTLTPYI